MSAKLVSVNVGRPRAVEWRGETVTTAIFKAPVAGPVAVRSVNLAGDSQADLTVHGGENKAVYAYPSEHYPWWGEQYPDHELAWGAFGENLSTAGLLEEAVRIGDRFRVGTAELEVAQPRMPCFKLGIRFGDPRAVKRFRRADRPGFYLRVVREGELRAGDALQRVASRADAPSVVSIARLAYARQPDPAELEAALALPHLGPEWSGRFAQQLGR